jgi:hypothetical protein
MPSGMPAGRQRYFRAQLCRRQLFQTQLRAGRVQCQVREPAKGLIPEVRELEPSVVRADPALPLPTKADPSLALRMTN